MDMNQANILVCDDEVEVADLLKHVLEREGFAVTCCHSGDAALTLLNAQVFDLAILDIMMPGIDGFEVCRQIRGGAAGSNTDMPIVFLSAKTEEFDKVLGFTLGADDYVTKPFKARERGSRSQRRALGERHRARRNKPYGGLARLWALSYAEGIRLPGRAFARRWGSCFVKGAVRKRMG